MNQLKNPSLISSISWASIIAGVVSVLGIGFLLNLLSLGFGLSNFGLESIIWYALASILSMFIGGWVTGKLTGNLDHRVENMIDGFLMWTLSTFLMFFISTTSLSPILGSFSGATEKIFTAGNLIEFNTLNPDQSELLNKINVEANNLFEKAESLSQAKSVSMETDTDLIKSAEEHALDSIEQQFSDAIKLFLKSIGTSNQEKAKQDLANILVDHGNISESKANILIHAWENDYQLSLKAHSEKSSDAHSHLSTLAFLALLISLLGAVAASLGALSGGSRRV